MRKIISFIRRSIAAMMMLCAAALLFGCDTPTIEDSGEEPYIYDEKTKLNFVVGEDSKYELAMDLQSFLDVTRGIMSKTLFDGSEVGAHEIVVGNTSRRISKTALEEMKAIEKKHNLISAYLIYSDGESVAIVFDKDELRLAESEAYEAFEELCVKEGRLELDKGVVSCGSVDLYEYFKAADDEYRSKQWIKLEATLDKSYAKEFVDALKDLYSLYTPDVVTWLANLYEPNICLCYGLYGKTECEQTKYCGTAGIYYSNSGRDHFGYLPDVESAGQALGYLESSGMSYRYGGYYSKWLPDEVKLKMGLYAQALQDENGYFYHPQWGKAFVEDNNKQSRRSRDLSHATGLLSLAGLQPYYDTPNGIKGIGAPAPTASLTAPLVENNVRSVSFAILTAEKNYPVYMEDADAFFEYLNSYDIRRNSYSVGNRFVAQVAEIITRDKTIGTPESPTPLMDLLIDHLVENQNPETGCWNWRFYPDPYGNTLLGEQELEKSHVGSALYESVNGLLKISGIFTSAGKVMPYAREAAETSMKAIIDTKPLDAVTSLYNTWFAIQNITTNLRSCGGEEGEKTATEIVHVLRGMAVEGLRASKEKIKVFKKSDGSFSYTPMYSCETSQGCPVALPKSVEGDVNATVISTTGIINHAMKALDLRWETPILFGEAERLLFLDIITNKESAEKTDP